MQEMLNLLYRFAAESHSEMKTWVPSIMRGIARQEFVKRAQEQSGHFCHPLSPDYGAGAQIAAMGKTIGLLDLPLTILQHTRDSMAAASIGLVETMTQGLYGAASDPDFLYSPIQSRLETNRPLIFETLMRVRAKYPELMALPVDMASFFGWYAAGLSEVAAKGRDISKAQLELDAALQKLEPSVAALAQSRIDIGRQPQDGRHASNPTSPSLNRQVRLRLIRLLATHVFFTPLLSAITQRAGLSLDTRPIGGLNGLASLSGKLVRHCR